ncbi:hypothetical protein ACFX19_024204 [Malus domestica]
MASITGPEEDVCSFFNCLLVYVNLKLFSGFVPTTKMQSNKVRKLGIYREVPGEVVPNVPGWFRFRANRQACLVNLFWRRICWYYCKVRLTTEFL